MRTTTALIGSARGATSLREYRSALGPVVLVESLKT